MSKLVGELRPKGASRYIGRIEDEHTVDDGNPA